MTASATPENYTTLTDVTGQGEPPKTIGTIGYAHCMIYARFQTDYFARLSLDAGYSMI